MDITKIRKMLQAQCEPEAVLTLNNVEKIDVEKLVGVSFELFVERCKKEGRALLQAKQFETAMTKNGNSQMLIFLGKQYLAQKADGQQLSLGFDTTKETELKLTIVHGNQNDSN